MFIGLAVSGTLWRIDLLVKGALLGREGHERAVLFQWSVSVVFLLTHLL
jgi:hypothetical protein